MREIRPTFRLGTSTSNESPTNRGTGGASRGWRQRGMLSAVVGLKVSQIKFRLAWWEKAEAAALGLTGQQFLTKCAYACLESTNSMFCRETNQPEEVLRRCSARGTAAVVDSGP